MASLRSEAGAAVGADDLSLPFKAEDITTLRRTNVEFILQHTGGTVRTGSFFHRPGSI
jgi:hypothetical protein